jgi:hypothetical protein
MLLVAQFRTRLLRISLALLGGCAAAAAFYDINVALGMLLGGFAGTLAFWLLARRVEQFQGMSSAEVQVAAMRGTLVRLGVYAAALWAAYLLDPSSRAPLAAAIFGILIPRFVMYGLAFTNLRRSAASNT